MDVVKPILLSALALGLAIGWGGLDHGARGVAAGGAAPGLRGDANCDGQVNSVDAALVLQLRAGLIDDLDCYDAADVNADGDVNSVDAALILQYAAGIIDGFGDELPPSTFEVDESVQPETDEIEGIDGGPPRPLASMTDAGGNQGDFVQDELLLMTDDPAEMEQLLERTGGELVETIEPHASLVSRAGAAGLTEPIPSAYVIRIEGSAVDTSHLADDLRAIDPSVRGDLRFSDVTGLGTFAAAASESADGLMVGLNMIMRGADFDERQTAEAASASDRSGDYSPNAFEWPYMRQFIPGSMVGVQDIGVGEAWRALELTGRLGNHKEVAVFDGGFAPNPDFPANSSHIGSIGVPNPDTGSDDWHGTHVVTAGFGRPDNGFGAAGPGGPVVDLLVVQSPGSFSQMIKYIFSDIWAALAEGPDIINISATVRIPAGACMFVCPPIDLTSSIIRAAGTLVIAAAGNEGRDVSRLDCVDLLFGDVCWEEAGWMPCEAWEVVCVGGLDWNSLNMHQNSNYGRTDDATTVDIYGPYEVWVTPQPAADGTVPDGPAQTMTGTSFSAPFVAGVAALIWAADPGLSPGEVEDILLNSAHKRWDLIEEYNPRRWVNAYDAVIQALGNAPPDLTITYPPSGAVYPKGATVEFLAPASDPEDGTPTVTWTSSIDGTIGGGTSFFTRDDLSLGTHTLTATATDSGGLVDSESVTITIRNDPPDVDIAEPETGSKFVQGEQVRFQGQGYDTSEGVLPDSRLQWSSNLDGVLGTGHELLVTTLSQGTHTITLRASDNQGSSDEESITVIINEPPPDLPPAVTIIAPEDGALLQVLWDSNLGLRYIDVTLVGEAVDPEDGPLTGASLAWWSRRQDTLVWTQLGNGSPLTTRIYQSGCSGGQEIMLVATDSAGNSRHHTIRVNWDRIC